ncbi:acid phosphatase/Vanadium-dependent haloperoxidase [Thelephora ganbajun]|uniref:Acid phosphatase/Vanadium-dependent haloperoxidase n=1 Tax=Thelephora ganbajun TaxID=370292 RepID=A0ACB6ZW19_THEGA|nr:acid phosphatase/Vanadium-dependent haloperoxidase [Thelephora ganbajun]
MTSATTNNPYIQPSQNGGIHGKSSHSKLAYGNFEDDNSDASSDVSEFVAVGRRDQEVYERTLQSWRAALRRPIVKMVERESYIIAAMQDRLRTPWLDTYFVYTSSLGTHTFFMTVLPIFYYFGGSGLGRALLWSPAFGVYATSLIKDLLCSPRPFTPPVTRLTFSSHHLEYGFPSTHTTNSISIALFLYSYVHRLYFSEASISSTSYCIYLVAIVCYAFSIVFGRIYTAMHSFTDCAFGVILGAAIWLLQHLYLKRVEEAIINGGWIVPIAATSICLLMVNQHPQPVDDCPCFEDAIAFISVVLGDILGRWTFYQYGVNSEFFKTPQPGSSYSTITDITIWWLFSVIKVVVGILLIFTWRIFAKSSLHFALPRIFRFLANIFTLPNRRFYTPATDYGEVPIERGLHPIPSFIDLPSQMQVEVKDETVSASTGRGGATPDMKKRRNGPKDGFDRDVKAVGEKANGPIRQASETAGGGKAETEVKHYDVVVLTKVIVYAGIGFLAIHATPVMFEILGWGV